MSSDYQKKIKQNKKKYKEEYQYLKNKGFTLKDRNDCIMWLEFSDFRKIEYNKYVEVYPSDLEFPRPPDDAPTVIETVIQLWEYEKEEYKKYNDEDYFNHYDDMTN